MFEIRINPLKIQKIGPETVTHYLELIDDNLLFKTESMIYYLRMRIN